MPPKKRRIGILGVPSSSRMLFTVGGDMWSEDDESDTDYNPGGEATLVLTDKTPDRPEYSTSSYKTTSVNRAAKLKKRKLLNRHDESSSIAETSGGESFFQDLPAEIIIRIFHYIVSDHGGAVPIMCRLSRVCKSFYRASKEPCLWQMVDLSYGWVKSNNITLKWLVTNRLTQVKHINLSSWASLNSTGIKIITDSCPTLESIILTKCKKVSGNDVILIVDKCKGLSHLDISYMSENVSSAKVIKYVIEKCSRNLTELNLSGNKIKGMSVIMKFLYGCCHNLKVLDISNCSFSTFMLNIEEFQAGCPKLKALRMANTADLITASSEVATSTGFPCLEEISLAADIHNSHNGLFTYLNLNFHFLYRLLKNSPRLVLLDIRGCNNISFENFEELPATALECLYISCCSIPLSPITQNGLENILIKWRHSLVDLDMSWNHFSSETLDKALRTLAGNHQPHLTKVNLSGTSVTDVGIRYLLRGCRNLEMLDLTSCRSIPRGCKRRHNASSITQLKDNLGTAKR